MSTLFDGNVLDQNKIPVPGAQVYIYASDGQLASLFDELDQPLNQPVISGEDGYWSAYVEEEGYYTFRYYWGGRERLISANEIAGRSPLQVVEQSLEAVRLSTAYAESMTGPTYASTAAGIAATSDGQGFAVDNGDGTVTVYLNDSGVAVEQRTLATTAYLASQDGAKAIGVKQRGASALLRTAEDALRDIPTLAGYPTVAAAIAAAVASNFVVGVSADVTVNIPSDAATLQIALDRLTPLNQKCIITLNIESGHTLTSGVSLAGRNCGQFRIISADSTVSVGFNGDIIEGFKGAKMPRLACLINAISQTSGNGIDLNDSTMTIESGCGVINCYATGLATFNGCRVSADGSNFSGAARNGSTGSCITAWASFVSADGANCTGSGYYGAQAAHGGTLSFRNGNASNAYRHGIRATDAAIIDADGATANGCGADGSGGNVRAFNAGIINFVGGQANGCLATLVTGAGLAALGAGSIVNADSASSTGNAGPATYAGTGGVINVVNGAISGSPAVVEVGGTVIRSGLVNEHGTYTPSVTLVTNVTAASAGVCQWSRVGKTVTVSGVLSGITASAAGGTASGIRISLPIASAFASSSNAGGAGCFYTTASIGTASAIYADTSNAQARFSWASGTTSASQAMAFTFTYLVQ